MIDEKKLWLTLRELESFASLLLTILLPLNHTRVSCQKAGISKVLPVILVDGHE
jgi:hypothetical protein